uniref:Uncharacterized protein n=1 Tax=Rhizophora mucronata TaxID=61149 RepID=A0A2P2P232_RHIMU
MMLKPDSLRGISALLNELSSYNEAHKEIQTNNTSMVRKLLARSHYINLYRKDKYLILILVVQSTPLWYPPTGVFKCHVLSCLHTINS